MRIEFSKLIFWLVFLLVLGVTVFGCALMWRVGDVSGLSILIPAVFTEFATATGFYFWKARTENKLKLMKKYGLDIDKDDMEGGS